jgi:hypothetical protein
MIARSGPSTANEPNAPSTAVCRAASACVALQPPTPSDAPSDNTLRFVVNGTATARLAVREGDTVTLEMQVLGGAAASAIIPSIPSVYMPCAALAARCLPVLRRNRGTGWGSQRFAAGDCSHSSLVAWVQGAFGLSAATIRCESSNSTLLQLVCASPTPTVTAPRTSPSCDLPVPSSAGGVFVTLVAMEDFDNGGPAVKAACLVCTGPASLGSGAVAVGVDITNVVRPIVGDADFAEGGNKSEARSVLRGGAPCLLAQKRSAASACPTHPLHRVQAKGPLRSSRVAEGCSRCARTQVSASSRHQHRSRCPHSSKQSSRLPHRSRLCKEHLGAEPA